MLPVASAAMISSGDSELPAATLIATPLMKSRLVIRLFAIIPARPLVFLPFRANLES